MAAHTAADTGDDISRVPFASQHLFIKQFFEAVGLWDLYVLPLVLSVLIGRVRVFTAIAGGIKAGFKGVFLFLMWFTREKKHILR